jgi:hypothetical protein
VRARCGALLQVAGAGTFVALLAIGCATPAPPRDPRVRPVENLAERLVFQGFSVLPPQGQGWLIIPAGDEDPPRARTVVSLGKPLRERRTTRPEELHTGGARVLVLDVQDTRFDSPEAYRRFVEDEAKRGLTGRRFRQIESRYAIEPEGPAPLCVRHETVVEDSQVPGFRGAVFVLAARGLRCVHPHWPQYLVDVSYSQRMHRGQPFALLEPEGEPFIQSLRFTADRPSL